MGQRAFGQQVQYRFQRAGERRLVDRRSDHQAVGVFDLGQQVQDLGAIEAGMEQILGGKITHLIAHHFHTLLLQPTLRALQQHS
jgi:hypothetical protein